MSKRGPRKQPQRQQPESRLDQVLRVFPLNSGAVYEVAEATARTPRILARLVDTSQKIGTIGDAIRLNRDLFFTNYESEAYPADYPAVRITLSVAKLGEPSPRGDEYSVYVDLIEDFGQVQGQRTEDEARMFYRLATRLFCEMARFLRAYVGDVMIELSAEPMEREGRDAATIEDLVDKFYAPLSFTIVPFGDDEGDAGGNFPIMETTLQRLVRACDKRIGDVFRPLTYLVGPPAPGEE